MPPATVNAHAAEPATRPLPAADELLAAWRHHQQATRRGNPASDWAARSFLGAWPNPQAWADQPLDARLTLAPSTMSLLMFLMTHGWLRPGWDWLVSRKLSSFWREAAHSPLAGDMARFVDTATAVGFTPIQARRAASQSIGRVLLQTGRRLDDVTVADLDALAEACRDREVATGQGWHHYRGALACAHTVLFHLDIITTPPAATQQPETLEARFAVCLPALRPLFVAYLERMLGTCRPKSVSSLATRLAHFARFLTATDPELTSLAGLDRRRHIEPYLNSVAAARATATGEPVTAADQDRRIRAVEHMLA